MSATMPLGGLTVRPRTVPSRFERKRVDAHVPEGRGHNVAERALRKRNAVRHGRTADDQRHFPIDQTLAGIVAGALAAVIGRDHHEPILGAIDDAGPRGQRGDDAAGAADERIDVLMAVLYCGVPQPIEWPAAST